MATASLELLADSSQIRTATKDLDRLNSIGTQTDRVQNNLNKSIKQTSGSMAGLSKNFGQAGIQVQQFVGQIQGGQSGLLALSQQGADLGIVLGQAGLGAAIGIAATALSFMIGNSDDATSALDRLDDIAETVGKTLEQAADGSDVFSESIQRLANRSEALARVQIAQTISELNEQISTSARGIREAISDFNGIRMDVGVVDTLQSLGLQLEDIPSLFGEISSQVDTLGAGGVLTIRSLTERIDLLASSLGISREQATSLQIAIDDFSQDQSATGIARLRGEIESLTTAVGVDNEKLVKLASSLTDFFESSRSGVDRINLLRQAIADLSGTIEENSGETDKASKRSLNYAQSLQTQIIALQGGAQAAEIYALTQKVIADGTESQLPTLIELVNQKYELKRAQEAAAESARQEAAAQKELESNYQQFLRIVEQAEEAETRKAERQLQSFESLKQQIALQESQILLDSEQYELRRNLLALGEGASQSQIDEITALTEQMQALRFEAELLGPTLENSLRTVGLSAMDDLAASMASAVIEGDSLSASISNIAGSIANELLSALIRYAIGAAAQAAGITAAFTPAAITSSIATGGASAVSGAAAFTAAAGSIMGAITGFEKGGYTGNYGTKEVAGVVHGQEFVMNARATRQNRGALEAMNSGKPLGGDTYVNVTNNATNSNVETQESTDSQGNRVIDIVVNNINQRGKIHKAMTQTTTASNRI